ncbi:alpha-N-acetylgalactosaminide alpha-2,6-sialyltransferase 1 isoform X2 [Pseudophryne corroboree]|uniref:alpha-N-acetylgalactosaminide alpha-2,6-sialyltransferase 1 isoform X2 n=1 Tax=Pseudophryne corroboree TaxID=495146 RepID=UPI0030816767
MECGGETGEGTSAEEHKLDYRAKTPSITDIPQSLIEKNKLTEQFEDKQPSVNSGKEKHSVQATKATFHNLSTPINETSVKVRLTSPAKRNVQSTSLNRQAARKPLISGNFTSEPKWGIDEDDYTMVISPLQTSCPISVKIKARHSPWMKDKFLPHITIFMDDRHFSNKEWDRLEHFVPPFGWMELNYTVVQEVVSALPYVPDQQLLLAKKSNEFPRCDSCAVVGNGGILNASRLGKEIDAHDYVFRVNGAVIKGYEEDVGVRTSFYGFTAFTMLSSIYLLNRNGFANMPQDKETKYILFAEGQRDYEWLQALQQNKEISKAILHKYRLHPRDEFRKTFDLENLFVTHPDFVRYLKNRFLRSNVLNGKYWRVYRPSTGALLLLTALHLCDKVSAYGFMTQDFRNYSDHYYDKQKTEVTLYINHDFLLEKEVWAHLHNENIIKLYQRT